MWGVYSVVLWASSMSGEMRLWFGSAAWRHGFLSPKHRPVPVHRGHFEAPPCDCVLSCSRRDFVHHFKSLPVSVLPLMSSPLILCLYISSDVESTNRNCERFCFAKARTCSCFNRGFALFNEKAQGRQKKMTYQVDCGGWNASWGVTSHSSWVCSSNESEEPAGSCHCCCYY